MKKMSADIIAIYHKNLKVKVSDVLTGFCCAPKFCDGHTDTHCQFLTQLKLRIDEMHNIEIPQKSKLLSLFHIRF